MIRKMQSHVHLVVLVLMLVGLASCSTKVYITQPESFVGKKIAFGQFAMQRKSNQVSTDSICTCIAENVRKILQTHFIESGLSVIDLPSVNQSSTKAVLQNEIDSLGIDIIVSGNGLVYDKEHKKKKEVYININQLSVECKDARTGTIVASGYFSGVPFNPYGGAIKMGKQFQKQIQKSVNTKR